MLDPIMLLTEIRSNFSEETISYKILEAAIWHLIMGFVKELRDSHVSIHTVETFWRIYAKSVGN